MSSSAKMAWSQSSKGKRKRPSPAAVFHCYSLHCVSPHMAHRDARRFDSQPSLSGHCGHGRIFIAQRSVANDPGCVKTFAQPRPERDIASAFGNRTSWRSSHPSLGFHSKSSACRCLDMPSQLVQGLVAVLDGAEADPPVALCFGRMQLPQRDHGLAVALLIERNRGAKTAWI